MSRSIGENSRLTPRMAQQSGSLSVACLGRLAIGLCVKHLALVVKLHWNRQRRGKLRIIRITSQSGQILLGTEVSGLTRFSLYV